MADRILNENEMKAFAQTFSRSLKPGDGYLLEGEMGSGKTTFVRYVCEALGYDAVTSPTFSLVNVYPTDPQVIHMDLYRVETEQGVLALDLERYWDNPNSVCLIEWPKWAKTLVPDTFEMLLFEFVSPDQRRVKGCNL